MHAFFPPAARAQRTILVPWQSWQSFRKRCDFFLTATIATEGDFGQLWQLWQSWHSHAYSSHTYIYMYLHLFLS